MGDPTISKSLFHLLKDAGNFLIGVDQLILFHAGTPVFLPKGG
jgi:hypothetical protein